MHPLSGISFYDPRFPMKVKQLENPQEMYSHVGIGSAFVEYWVYIYVRHPEQQEMLRPLVHDYFMQKNMYNGSGNHEQSRQVAQEYPPIAEEYPLRKNVPYGIQPQRSPTSTKGINTLAFERGQRCDWLQIKILE